MTLVNLIRQKKGLRWATLVLSGLLMALTVIFPNIGALAWVGMIPGGAVLLILARDRSVRLRAMYGYSFLYFMAFYSVGFHWFIAMYPLSFVEGMTKLEAMAVVVVATFGLGALQSAFSAFFGVLLAVIARGGLCRRCPIVLPLTAGIAYPIFEWAQTFTWAGVPWSRLAAGQVEWTSMLKTVSLFGPYFLSALIVTVNFLLAELLLCDSVRRKRALAAASALTVALAACMGGVAILADRDEGSEITVAAIQPNVSSLDPWGFDTIDLAMELVEQYALDAATNGATLIVLPETIYPVNFYEVSYICEFSKELAINSGATVAVGAFADGESGDRNSLIYIEPDGSINETSYAKRRLVPFGEFVPWRGFIEALMPQLADLLLLESDLEAATDSGVADTSAGRLGGLICFDSIYESLALDSVRDGAELIVLSTNDSWFTGSRALEMHASQARLRAVETGRYVVRSASTGISMIISPDGDILDYEPEENGGYALATVKLKSSTTLYTVIGNTFVYLSLAAVAAVLVSSFILDRRDKSSNIVEMEDDQKTIDKL